MRLFDSATPTLLLAVAICVALGTGTTATFASVSSDIDPVPPLPFPSFGSWVVRTLTTIDIAGNATIVWSYGAHANVDLDSQLLCEYDIQQLQPVAPDYTVTFVANYSSGFNRSAVLLRDGSNVNCSASSITGPMQPGGIYYLAPTPEMMDKLHFQQYAHANGANCSVWQYENPTEGLLVQWYIEAVSNIPQLLINQTRFPDGTAVIHTTAFNGYHSIAGINAACVSGIACGARTCVANPAAPLDSIYSALGWVCGVESCADINLGGDNYYPNTPIAHGTWAFNKYYMQHQSDGAGACNFNGAAQLVTCDSICTTCNASATVSADSLRAALDWVCGPDGIQTGGCAPIRPGGDHFYPNTTQAHASWAFNVYYQAYRCVPGWAPCDFNGTAEVLPCT